MTQLRDFSFLTSSSNTKLPLRHCSLLSPFHHPKSAFKQLLATSFTSRITSTSSPIQHKKLDLSFPPLSLLPPHSSFANNTQLDQVKRRCIFLWSSNQIHRQESFFYWLMDRFYTRENPVIYWNFLSKTANIVIPAISWSCCTVINPLYAFIDPRSFISWSLYSSLSMNKKCPSSFAYNFFPFICCFRANTQHEQVSLRSPRCLRHLRFRWWAAYASSLIFPLYRVALFDCGYYQTQCYSGISPSFPPRCPSPSRHPELFLPWRWVQQALQEGAVHLHPLQHCSLPGRLRCHDRCLHVHSLLQSSLPSADLINCHNETNSYFCMCPCRAILLSSDCQLHRFPPYLHCYHGQQRSCR